VIKIKWTVQHKVFESNFISEDLIAVVWQYLIYLLEKAIRSIQGHLKAHSWSRLYSRFNIWLKEQLAVHTL